MKKKDIIILLIALLSIGGVILFSNLSNKKEDKTEKTKPETTNLLSGKYNVEIKVKKYGTIKIELDADEAPITVTNFINLVNEGFYDGLTFHRIIDNFMIQGGGYKEDGSYKNADTIKGEFINNGYENNISHKRGVISMARANSYDSGSSQFFITNADSFHLDGNYAAFGYVTKGMDVVDKIAKDAKPTDKNGSIKIEERPVIEYIKVIE